MPRLIVASLLIATASAFVPSAPSFLASTSTWTSKRISASTLSLSDSRSTIENRRFLNLALYSEASTDDVEAAPAEVEAEVEIETEAEAETETEAAAPVEAEAEAAPEAKEHTAYVVNLAYETTGKEIRELFSTQGNVTKTFLPRIKDSTRGKNANKGIAFVTMETPEGLQSAISNLHQSQLGGRTIYVTEAKPRGSGGDRTERVHKPTTNEVKLYVGNISYETTKDELMEYFAEGYGPVKDCYIPTDQQTGLPRGFAFLTMVEKEDADKAIEAHAGMDVELGGRRIDVKVSLPRGQKAPPRQRKPMAPKNEVKIYIGNLSFDTEYDTLADLFEDFGPVVDLYMPIDRYTERPRGFAFATLEPENASRAIEELDGFELDGRILRVNEAQPKGWSSAASQYNNDEGEGDWGYEEGEGDWAAAGGDGY